MLDWKGLAPNPPEVTAPVTAATPEPGTAGINELIRGIQLGDFDPGASEIRDPKPARGSLWERREMAALPTSRPTRQTSFPNQLGVQLIPVSYTHLTLPTSDLV